MRYVFVSLTSLFLGILPIVGIAHADNGSVAQSISKESPRTIVVDGVNHAALEAAGQSVAYLSTSNVASQSNKDQTGNDAAHKKAPVVLGVAEDAPLVEGVAEAASELAAQKIGSKNYDERELRCLAEGIYFEARGEPVRGQLAVGQVILNRVASKAYPNTVCDVVYQNNHKPNRCQFSFACDGKPETIAERKSWFNIRVYAEWLLVSNSSPKLEYALLASLSTATHYHADYVDPHWASDLTLKARIGSHIFYATPARS